MRQLLFFVRTYVCMYNSTQTFRENVEMLTINSICMRMWVWECVCLRGFASIVRYPILFVQFTVSFHRWKSVPYAACYAMPCTNCWQIDNLCKTFLYLSWEKTERLNYSVAFFIYSILSMLKRGKKRKWKIKQPQIVSIEFQIHQQKIQSHFWCDEIGVIRLVRMAIVSRYLYGISACFIEE